MTGLIEVLNRAGGPWWSLVVQAGGESAVVAVVSLWLAGALRHRPAALRHGIVALALLKFLCPPLPGLLGPVAPRVVLPAPVSWAVAEAPPAPPHPTTAAVPTASALHWKARLMLLHGLGTLGLLAAIAGRARHWQRLVRSARPCPRDDVGRWLDAQRLRWRMRRPVRLLVAAGADSPLAAGLLRPTILLPEAVLALPCRDIETVLAHELAHLRRGDVWAMWLQALACALWWFHPLVWLTGGALRRLREDCCDDLVLVSGVADGAGYCGTLLRVASGAVGRPASASAACGMVSGGHPLADRLHRIMDDRVGHAPGLSRSQAATVLLLAGLLLPGWSAAANPPPGDEDRPPPRRRLSRMAPDSPSVHRRPARVPRTPDDLAGRWLLTLPAGFAWEATWQPRGDHCWRLDVAGAAVALEGLYEWRDRRLIGVRPDDPRMTGYEWKIVNARVLLLTAEATPSPNGANYVDATLTRDGGPDEVRRHDEQWSND